DKAAANRIADKREYNRDGPRFLLKDPCHLVGAGHDYVRRHADQFSCKGASLVGIAPSPTIVDLDIASLNPAKVFEASPQRRNIGLSLRIALGVSHEHANAPHPLSLLRARRERPGGRCAAGHSDELAPLQCWTSPSRVGLSHAHPATGRLVSLMGGPELL